MLTRPELLLGDNIPPEMHGMAPRVVLGQKWWNKTRVMAYKSTNYHCKTCGVNKKKAKGRKWLEGHEVYRIDHSSREMIYLETVPLCHYCHNYIHDGRLHTLLKLGKVSHAKYRGIIQHGDMVLSQANLTRPTMNERIQASHSFPKSRKRWRLVINGKPYFAKDWLC